MQNFIGTEWEGKTEEEIFLSHQKLVLTTIIRRFPSNHAFCKAHMLEEDDLIQLGSIGLLNAIRTFDPNGKSLFRSYAINCIAWNISAYARKESLRTATTQSYALTDIISVETKLKVGDEEIPVLDTIYSDSNTSEDAEDNVLKQSVINFLKADKEIDEDLLYILVARINGETMQSIAEHFGTHRNTITNRLKRKKSMRIKNRLESFLKKGDL